MDVFKKGRKDVRHLLSFSRRSDGERDLSKIGERRRGFGAGRSGSGDYEKASDPF
jgi:hypothetical protein